MRHTLAWIIAFAIVIGLSVLGGIAQVKADYVLVMVDLSTDQQFGIERFIAYTDCRDRGLANQSLLALYDQRVGFMCPSTEEVK